MDIKAILDNIKEKGLGETIHIFITRRYKKLNKKIEDIKENSRYFYYEAEIALDQLRNKRNHYEIKIEDRQEVIDAFREIASNNEKEFGHRSTTDLYYDESVKEKTILLTGLGKSVRGNMFYILNELNSNPEFVDYKINVYTSPETDEIVHQFIDKNEWIRTSTIFTYAEYDMCLSTSQYIIAEANTSQAWIKREDQTYINTWHGTPLKKIGLAKNSKNVHKDGITQCDFIKADYLLYPNDYTEQNILASYKVADLMMGKAVKLGYPRTGGMLMTAQSDQTELQHQLAPNGERLYAYMPTWKDYLDPEIVVSEAKDFLDYMDEHLANDQLLYVNLHHKVSDSIDYSIYKKIKQFPSTIDSYQLLALTEVLITDYSSVFYDYLALRRQIILYCPDFDLYKQKRGVYMDLDELPFDKATTPADVIDALKRGKTYDDYDVYQRFCCYDSVDNAKKLCELLTGCTDDVKLENIPKSGEKQVLIYSHTFEDSVDTKRLRDYVKLDKDYRIYIGCEMFEVDSNIKSAYPTFHNIPVFGVKEDFHLTSAGKTALEMYQEGIIPLKEAMKVLAYDYKLAYKRMFGGAQFDLVVIYDLSDPEMLIALALMKANKKMFYLSDDAYERLIEGDKFYQDAVQYALQFIDQICVNTKEKLNLLKSFCKQRILLQEKSTARDLNYQISRFLDK